VKVAGCFLVAGDSAAPAAHEPRKKERKKGRKEPDRRRHNPSSAFPLSTMQVKLLKPLHFLPQEIKISRNFPCLVALPVERTLSLRTAWFFPVCDLKSIAKCFVVLRIHLDSFSTFKLEVSSSIEKFRQISELCLWNIERRETRKWCFVGIGDVAVGAAFGQVFNGNPSCQR
jgi:hypothetical protein